MRRFLSVSGPLVVASILCATCVFIPNLPGSAQGAIISQGVQAIGADVWHAAGYDGTGVKVAVWDYGFYGYQSLLGTELPPANRVITRGFGMPIEGFPDEDPEDAAHGTAVAEIVYDIAPGATYYLVATDSDADAIEALEWLADEGVRVIVASISVEGFCLDAGASVFEPTFRRLRDRGVLLVVASGNDGASHWQGTFVDTDGDGLHEFTPGDESISVELFEGEFVDILLQWDNPCQPSSNDFVLRMTDERGRTIIESDYDNSLDGPIEDLYDEIPRDGLYHIEIELWHGSGVMLDLVWANGPEFEHATRAGSVGYFEPAVSPNALTVGAINWKTLDLESTSSGGPTKDGRIKPDLVAPTCVVSSTYGGGLNEYTEYECGFEGTSAAAPYAGGAAVLVMQAFPSLDATGVQDYLEDHAVDMGAPGKDNVYGSGRLLLPPPP